MRQEQRSSERLRLGAFRLAAAQKERLRACGHARPEGLAIRRLAVATGLSASRVHQLLTAPAAADTALREHLAEEVAALRRCLGALARAPTLIEAAPGASEEAPQARHRRRLAEPPQARHP